MVLEYELLQANWIQLKEAERWLQSMIIGTSLNVCSGMSKVGDVRLDMEPKSNRTAEAFGESSGAFKWCMVYLVN
jgi:hypothetical protein